jgi:hypothetical protein
MNNEFLKKQSLREAKEPWVPKQGSLYGRLTNDGFLKKELPKGG